MLMMGFLLGYVQNKHVPLHLENIICRSGISEESQCFIYNGLVCCDISDIYQKIQSCDSDIAFATQLNIVIWIIFK